MTKHKNPWTTLSKKNIYDNPWINIEEHKVLNPKGGEGIYGVVHFKNLAIGIVALDQDYNVYLVGQYRYPLKEYSWEIPEGGCPLDIEDPLDSAKRELQEETGLTAQKWTKILKMHPSNSVTDEYGYAYVAQGLLQGESNPEDTEELVVKKVSLAAAVQMCLRDEITDSLSVIALYKTKMLLDAGLLK